METKNDTDHGGPEWGEPAPWFTVKADCNPAFSFSSVAGRYIVMFFFESSLIEERSRALALFLQGARRFDGRRAGFAGVTVDPADETPGSLNGAGPAVRFFFDTDRKVSSLYGAAATDGIGQYRPVTYILDPRLRVLARLPLQSNPEQHVASVFAILDALPSPAEESNDAFAPVLVVPRVFDSALCSALVAYYDETGGDESGFMRQIDGRTRVVHDSRHKIRKDRKIEDNGLREAVLSCIRRRLVPEIAKTFQFQVTRVERHLVACYDAATSAHFAAHRDNTTLGTQHRRFAVTANLNAGAYEGGALRFPEFGSRTYVPPTGAALVFSCSLLHEVLPVTAGRRYAYLPFLYDEAAAAVREQNRKFVGPG